MFQTSKPSINATRISWTLFKSIPMMVQLLIIHTPHQMMISKPRKTTLARQRQWNGRRVRNQIRAKYMSTSNRDLLEFLSHQSKIPRIFRPHTTTWWTSMMIIVYLQNKNLLTATSMRLITTILLLLEELTMIDHMMLCLVWEMITKIWDQNHSVRQISGHKSTNTITQLHWLTKKTSLRFLMEVNLKYLSNALSTNHTLLKWNQ